MVISMEEIIDDPDLAQSYIIYQSEGSFQNGRWVEGPLTQIAACGTITVASEKDIEMVPEGDRLKGAMVFFNKGPIYTTRTEPSAGLSDKMFWNGDWYKVVQVAPYGDYGFYKAIAVRLSGS